MQKLRNLRLAVRLGGAFGALALGLLVVAAVAFTSTDGLKTDVSALAVDVPRYTATVDGLAARLPEEAHLLAQHLYVTDGDLAAQDKLAARFETLARADEGALQGMIAILSEAPDAESRAAADGVRKLQDDYVAFLAAGREAIKRSRQETVDAVEERTGSRTLYTERDPARERVRRVRGHGQLQGHARLRRRPGRAGGGLDRVDEAR